MKKKDAMGLLRGAVFFLLLLAVVYSVSGVFGIDAERCVFNLQYFTREKPGTLDAVYIGSSNVHAFWEPAFGWDEYGIAVWNYSTDGVSQKGIKYYLTEAKKTQPQAVFLINLNVFKFKSVEVRQQYIHRMVDYFPLSLNKIRMIRTLSTRMDDLNPNAKQQNPLEYYFPIIRFHSRWDSLKPWALGADDRDYKSSFINNGYTHNVMDLTDSCRVIPGKGEVAESVLAVFTDLLDYCDATGTRVLFVKVPQANTTEEARQMNTLESLAQGRGYPCLDLMEKAEEIGILPGTDYYNENHTNVHGSLKFSDYLGRYLVEQYGFTDKRGQPDWESWDRAARDYMDYVSPYCLPFEREHAGRSALDIPAMGKPAAKGKEIRVSWEPVDGAEGYQIYRKSEKEKNGFWHLVATVGDDTDTYLDTDLKASTQYTYTVVPFCTEQDEMLFGYFDVLGASGRTGG